MSFIDGFYFDSDEMAPTAKVTHHVKFPEHISIAPYMSDASPCSDNAEGAPTTGREGQLPTDPY